MSLLRFHAIAVDDGSPHVLAVVARTVRCGSCRRWLHVDEEELIASLDHPLSCWTCDHRAA